MDLFRMLLFVFCLAIPAITAASDVSSDLSDEGIGLDADAHVDSADCGVSFSPSGELLIESMADGFKKLIRRESKRWYECGEETPYEMHGERAEAIARGVMTAMREYDVRDITPWAAMAVIFSESRGDQCAIGPHSRRAARELGLIREDKMFNMWTRSDVESVITSDRWNKVRRKIGADLGLGQDVWKRYARIIDADGDERCSGMACRVPTIDEILSVDGGTRVVVTGLVYRAKMYRSSTPWGHWPGSVRDLGYEAKISRTMRLLGRTEPVKWGGWW